MKHDQLYKFDFQLSPGNPLRVDLHHSGGTALPTILDMHKAVHLGFLVRGSMESITRGQIYEVKEDECYLIAPWEPHGILRRTATEIMLVSIDADELFKIFYTCGNNLRNLLRIKPPVRHASLNSPENQVLITEIRQQLYDGLSENDPWNSLRQWNSLSKFFIELDARLKIDHVSSELQRLNPAMELIHGSNGQRVSPEAAAQACGLGASRFCHLFKEAYGIAFGSHELQYRLNCAAGSLLYGNLSLKDAAERWGFFDAAHFCRYFKKYFGTTPGNYQRLNATK